MQRKNCCIEAIRKIKVNIYIDLSSLLSKQKNKSCIDIFSSKRWNIIKV